MCLSPRLNPFSKGLLSSPSGISHFKSRCPSPGGKWSEGDGGTGHRGAAPARHRAATAGPRGEESRRPRGVLTTASVGGVWCPAENRRGAETPPLRLPAQEAEQSGVLPDPRPCGRSPPPPAVRPLPARPCGHCRTLGPRWCPGEGSHSGRRQPWLTLETERARASVRHLPFFPAL